MGVGQKPTRNALRSFRGTPRSWPLVLLIQIGYSDQVAFIRTEIEGFHVEPRWPTTWSQGDLPRGHTGKSPTPLSHDGTIS